MRDTWSLLRWALLVLVLVMLLLLLVMLLLVLVLVVDRCKQCLRRTR